MWPFALALIGCGGDEACPEGQIRDAGGCATYEAGDPVDSDAWRPAPGTSWQWQLSGDVDTSLDVAMYDIDLFEATDADLAELSDRIVICYFSAGSVEAWRPDAGDFPPEAVGRRLQGWPGERWVDVMDPGVRDVMSARLDAAVARGCDGVEPDNVTAFAEPTGLPVNATEQLDYNRWLADEAHRRGLSVGLKNDVDQIDDLFPWFDWALNEECVAYDECDAYETFTSAGKAAFHVEYVERFADAPALADEVCGVGPDLDTLIKTWDLGPERLACP